MLRNLEYHQQHQQLNQTRIFMEQQLFQMLQVMMTEAMVVAMIPVINKDLISSGDHVGD